MYTSNITYQPVKIKLINNDDICFSEIEREGYKEGQVIEAENELINGQPTDRFYFGKGGRIAAYSGYTCEVYQNKKAT